MTRNDREGAAAAEPLSRLLARSEAASREVEDVLAKIDELVARLEDEDGSAPEEIAEVEGSDGLAEVPAVPEFLEVPEVAEVPEAGEVPEVHVVVEARPAQTPAAVAMAPASHAPRSDPWRYLTERLLLAHDTANGDGSVDHDIVILQEAARRRLSDER